MKKINIHFIFALSLICLFYFNQRSYTKQNTVRVPEYGTGINKSWNDRFCVGFVQITKNNSSLGETQMRVLGSRNTYRDNGTLLIKLLLEDLYINSEIQAKNIVEISSSEFSIHAVVYAENNDTPIIFKTSTFKYERSELYINASLTIGDDVYYIKGTLKHNPNFRE
ncbi:hypothetical protein [Brachyspira innocens]|uniref:hypothetical protein n=1 Tax=Brachyspira innocens TaxID=13264 RepID=UPI00037F04F3|nr:hypothetical protein [Brachyspira innocens]